MSCLHRVPIAAFMNENAESRNDFFSAIWCHWGTAPKVVVCDVSCMQARYCMAREPVYFGKTLFVIDPPHVVGHTACSEAFDMREYVNSGSELFEDANGSSCEQIHSRMRVLEHTLAWMHANSSDGHALLLVKVFLDCIGRDRNRVLLRARARIGL